MKLYYLIERAPVHLGWRIWTLIAKLRLCFMGARYGADFKVTGRLLLLINPSAKVGFGAGVTVNSGPGFNPVGAWRQTVIDVSRDATLTIGDNVGLSNCTIVAQRSVSIGDETRIGGAVEIYDTDFHSITAVERLQQPDLSVGRAPVCIGKRCFIGAGATILKGVEIGDEAVVGARSVVTRSIPPGEIWAGNPARKIRSLK